MTFTLTDLGAENNEFRANAWNWKTVLEIVKSFDVISEATLRQINYNATGVTLEEEEAHIIGERIRSEILPKLEPNKRIFSDLSITDAPDDGTLYHADDEKWKNYSANYDWLKEFSDFCIKSKGFQVY